MTRSETATRQERAVSRLARDLENVRRLTLPDGTTLAEAFEADLWIERQIVRAVLKRYKSGRPRWRELLFKIHRGSGKTSIIALLMLLALDGEPFTEIAIISLDKDGAREITSVLNGLLLRQPQLADVFVFRRDEVLHKSNGSRLQILSADVTTAYSFGASARRVRIVIDEFSRHRTRDLYDSLASALAKFDDAQLILLSNGFIRPSWSYDVKQAMAADSRTYVYEPHGLIASWIPLRNLKALRKRVPPQIFARDFENEDVDATGEEGLIPLAMLYEARSRRAVDEGGPIVAGIDVAGAGEDETVLTLTTGGSILGITAWPDADPRGKIVAALRRVEHRLEAVNVDSAGLGWGLYLHLRDIFGSKVHAVNVGESPTGQEEGKAARELYANLKAQRYWALRKRFEAGEIAGLLDPVALDQLSSLRYEVTPRGQIAIESKDAAWKRGVKSPDRAESIMLALGEPETEELFVMFGWVYPGDDRKEAMPHEEPKDEPSVGAAAAQKRSTRHARPLTLTPSDPF